MKMKHSELFKLIKPIFCEEQNMFYGQEDEDSLITNYLDAHIETAIKQENLDKILDIIDNYIDLAEEVIKLEQ